jgi:hypothetical protein
MLGIGLKARYLYFSPSMKPGRPLRFHIRQFRHPVSLSHDAPLPLPIIIEEMKKSAKPYSPPGHP